MKKDKFNEVVKSYLHSIYAKFKRTKIDQISKICSLFANKKKFKKFYGQKKIFSYNLR